MNNRIAVLVFYIFFIVYTASVWGSDVTIPHTFTGGQPAYATEVNDNFTAVATAINDNDLRLDNLNTIQSVEGVSNDEGNIDLVAGGTVSITSNDTANTITISASADGGNATTLDGVDSTSFFILNQNETVSGRPAFNGGVSGSSAPFSVDSNTVVGNLNADLLDGNQASAFAPASHTHPFSPAQTRFSFIVYDITNGNYVASGAIDTNGSVMNSSGNVTAAWNGGSNRYEITISGHSYFWTNYHTSVTPYDPVKTWEVSSVGGNMLVYFYN